MFCMHCGREIDDSAAFCVNCGGKMNISGDGEDKKQTLAPQEVAEPPQPTHTDVLGEINLKDYSIESGTNIFLLHRKKTRKAFLIIGIVISTVGLLYTAVSLLIGPMAGLFSGSGIYSVIRLISGAANFFLVCGLIAIVIGILLIASFFIMQNRRKQRRLMMPGDKSAKVWYYTGLAVNTAGLVCCIVCTLLCIAGLPEAGAYTPTTTAALSPETTPPIFAPSQTSSAPQIGDIIEFGGYDWRVLDVQDGKALIITDEVISTRAYHSAGGDITWEKSDIRQYLNSEFLSSTFTSEERSKIEQTKVVNNDNPWYGTDGGRDTEDYIFLLSIEEVVEYFGDSGQLANGNPGSEYYIDDGYNGARAAYNQSGTALWWWLRSPGRDSNDAASVDDDGRIYIHGSLVYYYNFDAGARPALWLNP